MCDLSRLLLTAGVIFILLGALVYLGGMLGLSPGRLPGGIRIESSGGGLHVPLATSLLLSILPTIVINILLRIFRK
jgi:hypothetical protein